MAGRKARSAMAGPIAGTPGCSPRRAMPRSPSISTARPATARPSPTRSTATGAARRSRICASASPPPAATDRAARHRQCLRARRLLWRLHGRTGSPATGPTASNAWSAIRASSTSAPWPMRPRSSGSTNGSSAGPITSPRRPRITSATTRSTSSQNWRTPMLVIHGERDFRIPYSQSLGVFNALQRRNIPSRLVVFPDENHWILKPQNSIQWYREVHGWLDQLAEKGWRQTASQAPLRAPLSAPMTELPKTFDPAEIEARWYARWESEGLFRPERPEAEPFTIVIPPPNVTGSLHIGHALDNTLQDILIRHARLQGKDALWVVGMDHAGIATQMVVERQLERAPGSKRTDFSREEFIAKVWEWKARERRRDHPPAPPARRLVRLGERALHHGPGLQPRGAQGVRRPLQREGLLYRDKRLVNWDPSLRTAISDLEVETTRGAGPVLALPLSARGRQRRDLGRHHPARDDARRHGGRGASRRRALRGAGRQEGPAADHRPAGPDRRRRACRSGARLGRGQDHAGPRLQRFRGRQARRLQARRDAQHARCARRRSCRPPTA